jgi:sulfur carrier protein ThiS
MQDTDESMHIHVKLFSRFRALLPAEARGEATVKLPEGATVSDLLDHLGISGRIKAVAVNDDSEGNRGRVLQDGDAVRIFPFVVGG